MENLFRLFHKILSSIRKFENFYIFLEIIGFKIFAGRFIKSNILTLKYINLFIFRLGRFKVGFFKLFEHDIQKQIKPKINSIVFSVNFLITLG